MIEKFVSFFDISKIKSKDWLTFSIFVLISAVMWFFTSLSSEYSETIKVRYKYTEMPENKVVTKNLPEETEIEIKATGFELIDYKWFGVVPVIEINIKKDAVIKNNVLSFNSKIIRNILKNKLGQNVSILNDRLSNRTYKLALLSKKRVKVEPDIEINLPPQYQVFDEIKVSPVYVKAYGAKLFIDTLKVVFSEKAIFDNIKETSSKYVKLKKYNSIKFIPDSIKITVPVERFTEKIIKADINVINKPGNIKVQLLPAFVEIKFNVSFNDYQRIMPEQFRVIVDYNLIKKAKSNKISPRLIKHPKGIENIRISPKNVEFLLKEK